MASPLIRKLIPLRLRRFLLRLLGGGPAPAKRAVGWDCLGENSEVTGHCSKTVDGGFISIGDDCLIEGILKTESSDGRIVIGNNCYIGGGSILGSAIGIELGDDILISYQVIIMDSNNHSLKRSERKRDLMDWRDGNQHDWSVTDSKPVSIGSGSWIGARSIICKGVTLGEGSVVGAGSVVTKDVPPWTVVAGNPATLVRELGEDER